MAAHCTAASIVDQDTLEQIRLCDAEFYGAEFFEEDLTCLPCTDPTDEEYLSPTEDEDGVCRSIRRMSMPTGAAGPSVLSEKDEIIKVSHEFERGCKCHEQCYAQFDASEIAEFRLSMKELEKKTKEICLDG